MREKVEMPDKMPFEDLTGWKRDFWRAVTIIFLFVMLFNLVFHIISIYDRRSIRSVQDARARIAVDVINAVAHGRALTETEKENIKKFWSEAEYDAIQKELLDK